MFRCLCVLVLVDATYILLDVVTSGPFNLHGLTLIPEWISNHMLSKMWDEITYPFLNFSRTTVEV